MNYSIKVCKCNAKEGNRKGNVTLTFGNVFKIDNISVLENSKTGKLFVSMPKYKSEKSGKTEYNEICNPITKEFREELYGNILLFFEKFCIQGDTEVKCSFNTYKTPKYSLRIVPYEKEESSIRAFVHICFENQFVINNISIHQSKDKLFVSMPSYKSNHNGKDIYRDICFPVTKVFRESLYKEILKAYKEVTQ